MAETNNPRLDQDSRPVANTEMLFGADRTKALVRTLLASCPNADPSASALKTVVSAIIVTASFFIFFLFVFMRFSFCWLRIAEISRQIGEILGVVLH